MSAVLGVKLAELPERSHLESVATMWTHKIEKLYLTAPYKYNNGSPGCHFSFVLFAIRKSLRHRALRLGPNGKRQRNRLLRVARHWLGRPRICFCKRVSSLSIASSLRAHA